MRDSQRSNDSDFRVFASTSHLFVNLWLIRKGFSMRLTLIIDVVPRISREIRNQQGSRAGRRLLFLFLPLSIANRK